MCACDVDWNVLRLRTVLGEEKEPRLFVEKWAVFVVITVGVNPLKKLTQFSHFMDGSFKI